MSDDPPPNGFRTFLVMWGSQSISVLGSALTLFTVTIWLTQTQYPLPDQQQQLALAVTAVSLAHSLPSIIGAPLAGTWVDRHDRKRTMMAMDAINGCLSLILLSLLATNTLSMWLLLAIIVLSSFFSAFHFAAFDTSYAMIVPEKQLARANGMMQTIWDLSGIISPALAAFIIALPALARAGSMSGALGMFLARFRDGMPLAITFDALSFFLAALVLVFLHIPSPQQPDPVTSSKPFHTILADIKIGVRFIWLRRPLLWLLASFTVANLLGAPIFVFQPLVVKFNLAADWLSRGYSFENALALMNSLSSLGAVVGGIAISTWGGLKTRRVYGVLIPMVIAAAAETAFGLSSLLYASVAMIFIIGAMIAIMNSHTQAIWQAQTPHELQGRVFAVRRLIARFTWPFGALLAGWAAGLVSPGLVLAVMGSAFLFFSIVQLFNQSLLRAEDKESVEPLRSGHVEVQ